MRSQKQKDLRKLKYQLVKEITGSTKDARAARDLSSVKILSRYGVTLPKRRNKPYKQLKASTIKRKQRAA